MTKDEAIYQMSIGQKVTHRFFSSDEFMQIDNSERESQQIVYLLSGKYPCYARDFWNDRRSAEWQDDWEIYHKPEKKPTFQILPTDKKFFDSPDSGTKDCLCSRCGKVIPEDDVPLRCWPDFPDDENFEPAPEDDYEYRYCEPCMEASGISIYPSREDRKAEDQANW